MHPPNLVVHLSPDFPISPSAANAAAALHHNIAAFSFSHHHPSIHLHALATGKISLANISVQTYSVGIDEVRPNSKYILLVVINISNMRGLTELSYIFLQYLFLAS